ncbi:MAG: prepilin-type N-terminal cleavage/methylation domain-containing protein [Candidatus Yanofskybacteria bacterium]|nr:prepilin-type N-terminal cleavage/methylation domain-containing protein [Candidatus Yanofskybacteria bacterium]
MYKSTNTNSYNSYIRKRFVIGRGSEARGFTLIEVLVVAAITGFITTFLLINFSRTRINFAEEANIFSSKFRIAQTKAVSSARSSGSIRCGYGIRYINNQSYAVYVGENASVLNCSTQNKDYNPTGGVDNDATIETINFSDSKIEFKTVFRAIYFEPPDPKTFIIDSGGTVHNEPNYNLGITIGKVGGTCPQDCKTINIFTSGKIE